MRVKDFEYTNSEMERIIDEHIHSQRDRVICKRCFIDGITHERIAEEVDLTPRQVSNIISKNSLVIAKHLENRVCSITNETKDCEIQGVLCL